MFNFIFEGGLGEILAPMGGSNKLFLAIQHHRNEEIQSHMSLNSYETNEKLLLKEGGYGALHVAAKYNNLFALVLILNKGINVDFPDDQGNTPLHYAAKGGHVDACKILVERNSGILKLNRSRQTAYDAADGHDIVRQYLLPILLDAERQANTSAPIQPPAYMNNNSIHTNPQPPSYSQPPTSTPPPVGMPPPSGPPSSAGPSGPPLPFHSSGNIYSRYVPYDPHTNQAAPPGAPVSQPPVYPPTQAGTGMPPPGAYPQHGAGPPNGMMAPPTGSIAGMGQGSVPTYGQSRAAVEGGKAMKKFVPDGFHTSASDPVLQARYGHTKQEINVAPPPKFGQQVKYYLDS
jgi:hypothetical protein